RVRHVSFAGPVVRLSAERTDTGDMLEVELPKEKYQALRPQPGDEVWAHLKTIRVFPEDYSI
ncbi:MAG: cysA, partial [Phycisphaerales bacterium]|nr:cysA [Phycisphaerales bacterium]